MKNQRFIKRLALLLAFALFVPSLAIAMPAQETQAATRDMQLNGNYCYDTKGNYTTKNIKVRVEAGEKFSIADWMYYYNNGVSKDVSKISNVKYTSSKKSVMQISKNGTAVTSKTGTTTVTVKYGSLKVNFKVQVVKKGSLKNSNKQVAAYAKKVQKIAKYKDKKITDKNFEAILNAVLDAESTLSAKTAAKMYSGRYTSTNKIVIPQYPAYQKVKDELVRQLSDSEASAWKDTSSLSTKILAAKSITANKNGSFTVTLKNKIGTKDLSALYLPQSYYDILFTYNCLSKTNYSYKNVKSFIKKGTITIEPDSFYLESKSGQKFPFKLKVNSGSKKATLTINKDYMYDEETSETYNKLPAGTYTFSANARKVFGIKKIVVE